VASAAGSAAPIAAPRPGALAAVWVASAAVLAGCLLASFRMGFAEDLATLLRVNGPRVLLGAGVGSALALSGALRLAAGALRPLGELELLALSAGAAGGGFLLSGAFGPPALGFALGALLGGGLALGAVRAIDRPRRSTNLAALALLATFVGVGALTGTYARARSGLVAPAAAWLLGDLGGASWASALLVLLLSLALLGAALRAPAQAGTLAWLALGLGIGAAGPLAFAGTLVPRAVGWLAPGTSARALLPAAAVAGAATVAAIDAVPRLLVGGYVLPWNVAAGMLAVPIFLGWNRARLRREAGPASRGFEAAELALLAGGTALAVWLAWTLATVIRFAT
jgi:ABC-type Fe3+-siderophore transport system permease subunit